MQPKIIARSILFVLLGIIPYVYVVIAAKTNPPINWENPQTLEGFIRLITREVYGSFRSSPMAGLSPVERYWALQTAIETTTIDFTLLGWILATIGAVAVSFKKKFEFKAVGLGFLFTGPLFLIYASFPTVFNFHLGTVERFMLMPYLFFGMFIAFGISALAKKVDDILVRFAPHLKVSSISLFLLLPIILLWTNYVKLAPLKYDQTAEKLIGDLFSTAPDNAIIILPDDTTMFNAWYVNYTDGGKTKQRGLKIIASSLGGFHFYQDIVNREYPEIGLDIQKYTDSTAYLTKLVDTYLETYSVYAGNKIKLTGTYGWLPTGLLFKLYNTSNNINLNIEDYTKTITPLFAMYQDPLAGALGSYLHLMLADNLRLYGNANRDAGLMYVRVKDYEASLPYLRQAVRFQPESPENSGYLAESLQVLKQCNDAAEILSKSLDRYTKYTDGYRIMSMIYRDCKNDPQLADQYQQKYETLLNESKQSLDQY